MRLLIFIYSAQSSYDKNRVGKNATLNTKDKDGFGARYRHIELYRTDTKYILHFVPFY